MLDNIIGNDKAKFMTNYSKLTNELNDFLSLNHKVNGATIKTDTYTTKNKMNLFINEKIKNKNSKEKVKNIFSNEKNILDKNIFSEDIVKKEKWEKLKTSINPSKLISNPENNSNSVFDRIKNNLNKMKKEFTLEEAFQKNLENLNGLNIISPRNSVFNSLNSNKISSLVSNNNNNINFANKIIENDNNSNTVKDSILLNSLNNSKNINSNLKHKFNQYYYKQMENQGYNSDGYNKIEKKTNDLNLNQKSVRNKLIDFFYEESNKTDNKYNKPKPKFFDKKDKLKTEIFSVLDNRLITRTENAFYKSKPANSMLSLSSNEPFITNNTNNNNTSSILYKNKINTKSNLYTTSNKVAVGNIKNNISNNGSENSYEKLNNILSNYYEERKKQQLNSNSVSKNTEYIKRFKNRFEKGVKLIPIEKEYKKNFNFTKTSSNFYESKRPKSSVVDRWSKFDQKQNVESNREFTNSDILRLELINLNCYSNNEIEQLKGIEKLKVRTRKRSESINQL